ncbi:MAG: hypothetical protein HKP38_01045 [Croceitalea sp.]|nr:hypothetical protein [Croceitalea sp.]NNL07788.1 hypothetical protein [Croceitalea sp.]
MKNDKWITLGFVLLMIFGLKAQEEPKQQEDKSSYYEQRAKQDAEYEQSLALDKEADEADFWADQKQYEKDLKARDKKAYKAYMKGKRDAYAEHEAHCGDHCGHSDYYHHHAHFYYTYHSNYYRSPSRRATLGTRVKIGTPNLRVGLF